MATASHEHISASLSKSHHRAPISDLWGPSLSRKRPTEIASDYAMEIAMDTSRGPLMSSASSVAHHDVIDDTVGGHTETPTIPIASKVGSALWSPSPGAPKSVSPVTSHLAPGAPGSLPLRSLATPAPSTNYRGPVAHPVVSHPVASHHVASHPGAHPAVAQPVAPVTPVPSIGSYRSGIWGPRQNIASFNQQPAATFSQPSSVGSVYGKTPWSVDLGSNGMGSNGMGGGVHTPSTNVHHVPSVAGAAGAGAHTGGGPVTTGSVPVQNGFYGMGTPVSSSLPTGASSLHSLTPPRSSPSPPMNDATNSMRMYHGRGGTASLQATQAAQAQHNHQHNASLRNNHHGNHDMMNGNHGRPPKKNGRPSTNTELYKTELCASYMSTGGNCPYGEKCQFAHGPEELKTVDRPPKWRSKPCQNWVKTGTCSYNERCCFRHDVPVGYQNQS